MSINCDMLKVRVEMVESQVYGTKHNSSDLVQPRLKEFENKIQALERDVPAARTCSEILLKLHPLINEKKLQLNLINDKVESLLLRKEELQSLVSNLEAVRLHSGFLDSDFCQNIGK